MGDTLFIQDEWFVVKMDGEVAELHIFSEIGAFSSDMYQSLLNTLSGNIKKIKIYINSPGGSIFTGLNLIDLIRERQEAGVEVEAIITGLCASMASVIACACDKVFMYPESMIMIHNPSAFIEGDADVLRDAASVLDELKEKIVNIYLQKFKLSREKIEEMMDNETWISSDMAVKYGIAEIINAEEMAAVAKWGMESLKKFKLVPYNFIIKKVIENQKIKEDIEKVSALCEELRMSIAKRDELIRELQSKCDKLSSQLERAKAAMDVGLEFRADEGRDISWSEAVSKYGYVEARKRYPELWKKTLN